MARICPWCDSAFEPRKSGGLKQRFCRPAHRQAYWDAAAAYGDAMVQARFVSVETLKAHATNILVGSAPSEAIQPEAVE